MKKGLILFILPALLWALLMACNKRPIKQLPASNKPDSVGFETLNYCSLQYGCDQEVKDFCQMKLEELQFNPKGIIGFTSDSLSIWMESNLTGRGGEIQEPQLSQFLRSIKINSHPSTSSSVKYFNDLSNPSLFLIWVDIYGSYEFVPGRFLYLFVLDSATHSVKSFENFSSRISEDGYVIERVGPLYAFSADDMYSGGISLAYYIFNVNLKDVLFTHGNQYRWVGDMERMKYTDETSGEDYEFINDTLLVCHYSLKMRDAMTKKIKKKEYKMDILYKYTGDTIICIEPAKIGEWEKLIGNEN